jgi:hypothetical protein
MKSLKENTYYQILKLRVELFKNKELLLISISGFNPDKYDHKKISLTDIKENSTKNYDFKTASYAREEVRQLQKYFNEHKR